MKKNYVTWIIHVFGVGKLIAAWILFFPIAETLGNPMKDRELVWHFKVANLQIIKKQI